MIRYALLFLLALAACVLLSTCAVDWIFPEGR